VDDKQSKKLVILNNYFESTDIIKKLFVKNKINVEIININQYALNLEKYQNEILVLPDTFCEVINNHINTFANSQLQHVIVLLSKKISLLNNQQFSSLHVLDYIDTTSNQESIIETINKHIQTKLNLVSMH